MGAIGRALAIAGSMTWEILWALILGFALSAVVQAVVRRSTREPPPWRCAPSPRNTPICWPGCFSPVARPP
jgi:hypothetical protein